ncbi:MAG TPA: ABC transporter substrate-binding protein [Actinomycetes bacterium]|nr:ABC transporter substrate-binding protein [Actinomycetes bacterium]
MTFTKDVGSHRRHSKQLRRLVCALGLLLLVSCAEKPASEPAPSNSEASVRVASFDFSENLILAEIYAEAIRRAGIPVELLPELGTREVVGPALEQGEVDFVVDYLGSALEASDPGNPATHGSLEQARQALGAVVAENGIVVLDPAAAQDQNGFAVTPRMAKRLSSPAISALAPRAPTLVFGGPPECVDRTYCLIGLESVYGLHFERVEVIDTRAATAAALQSGEIDVGLLETTDARLAEGNLLLLRDDHGLQPRENVTPLARQSVIDEYGQKFVEAVNAVTTRLTTSALADLNRQVEIEGGTPAEVAAQWLDS